MTASVTCLLTGLRLVVLFAILDGAVTDVSAKAVYGVPV